MKARRTFYWRMLLLPLWMLGFFVYVFLIPASYDPMWWIPAGHGDVLGVKALKANNPHFFLPSGGINSTTWRELGLALKKDVDYFADYDVAGIGKRLPKDPVAMPDGSPLRFKYINETTSPFAFIWVSARPRVAYIPNFLTDEECDDLVGKAAPHLSRSLVAPISPADADKQVNDVRTSHQTWLSVLFGTARTVAERIFLLTGFEHGSSEDMQILRYGVSQKYDAHQDYFDPKLYGPQSSNRAVTVFLYLSDVEEGGETWFPNAMKMTRGADTTSCRGGLGVRPHKRSAVIFYDMTPTGDYDPFSLHGGCPVKQGTKWGGTLWLRVPT